MTGNTLIATILDGTKVYAAGLDTARNLMTQSDAFLENQSSFDRQARMRLPENVQQVMAHDYMTFLLSNVRPWSAMEIQGLASIFKSIERKFMWLNLYLPGEVYLVKTSGEEEGNSAYTRHRNTIVMSQSKVSLMGRSGAGGDTLHPHGNAGALENIYIHEFFHLFSKNNDKMRRELYSRIGYTQTDVPVELPETARWAGLPMGGLKITNPDTPDLNVAIDLVLPDDETKTPRPMLPVLLAKEAYSSGIFFEYLDWVFVLVDISGPVWKVPVDKDGQPTLVRASAQGIQRQYMHKVGFNITEEIFHPDEVLAQNFVLVMNEPSLGILGEISKVVSAPKANVSSDICETG